MELITILLIMLFITPGIVYYVKYRIDLNKIRNQEGIKGIIEKVEFIDNLGTGFDKLSNELYTLTVKLEDGREIKTNIRRNVVRLGRGTNYSWIPSKNDSIIIYDNKDGSYGNDYEIRFKKSVIPRVCIIYSIIAIMIAIGFIYAIIYNSSHLITYGDTVVSFKVKSYRQNTVYSIDDEDEDYHPEDVYADYISDYNIIYNSKGQYILNYKKTTAGTSPETTIEEQHKKINKEDVEYIFNNNEELSCKVETIMENNDNGISYKYDTSRLDFYYERDGKQHCLKITDDTENYFKQLLNRK